MHLRCIILSSDECRKFQVSIFKNVDFYKNKPQVGVKLMLTADVGLSCSARGVELQ